MALLLDDPVSSYAAMLAVGLVHAAYVPLDAGFPADRVAFIVDDAGARTVVTTAGRRGAGARRDRWPGRRAGLPRLHLRHDRAAQGRGDGARRDRQLRPRRRRDLRLPPRRPGVPGHDAHVRLLDRGSLGAPGRRGHRRAEAGRRDPWHRDERRFLNVYGPTEATVTATETTVHPDRAVTLGTPLPTYSVVLLDPDSPQPRPVGGRWCAST